MKIFIDEKNGSAYRLSVESEGEVEFAPLCNDGTFDFENEGGIVEVWSEEGKEAQVAEEKRIREALA